MERIIQSYLDYLMNVKLNEEYTTMNNKKNYIESQIKDVLRQDPNIIGKSFYYQLGGAGEFKDKDIENVKKLSKLFEEYTSHIKRGATNMDVAKVKEVLNLLKRQISEGEKTLNQLILPQYLPQDLTTVLTKINEQSSNPGFIYDLSQLYRTEIPIKIGDSDRKALDTYKKLLGEMETKLEEFNLAQNKRSTLNSAQTTEILEEIKKQKSQIKKNLEQLIDAKLFYINQNVSFEDKIKNVKTEITDNDFFNPNDSKETDIQESERIYNQLISTPVQGSTGAAPSRNSLQLLNENISTLLNDIKVDKDEQNINPSNVSLLYSPNFDMDKVRLNEEQKKLKPRSLEAPMGGGSVEIEKQILDFAGQINKYKKEFDEYKIELSKYNMWKVKEIYHTIYSLMVLTNALYNVPNYTIFKNVGRGTINFYLRIVNNIFEDLSNPKKYKDPMVAEIRKKHYITVIKLKYFLEEINKKFTSSSKRLRISNTSPQIKQMFTLLSHFRKTLEDYNLQGLSKVSIYSRINYIRGDRTKTDFNSYQNYAMFFSDAERLTKDQGYNFNVDFSKINSNNPNLNDKDKKRLEFIKKKDNDTLRDDRLMWVKRETCENKDQLKDLPEYRAVNFTEVFDSTQYGDNESISRYMNLASRLSTGNGICLITYGYSGTGKTYTLFGKIDEGKETKGLLQSTLAQLNGLVGIHFRLFELYGYGFSHPDYWKNVDTTPRINDISHKIFEYNLKVGGDKITVDSIEEYSANEIKYFVDHIQRLRGHKIEEEFENFYEKILEKGKNFNDTNIFDKVPNITPVPNGIIRTPASPASPSPASSNPASSNPTSHDMSKLKYLYVDGKNIEDVFGKFSEFTSEIDKNRQEGTTSNPDIKIRRIRDTPNNVESSRSVLVYDFILGIKEEGKIKLVSFLIIDLPGREEISKTFVEPFSPKKDSTDELVGISKILKWGYEEEKKKFNKLIYENIISNTKLITSSEIQTIKNKLGDTTGKKDIKDKWIESLNVSINQEDNLKKIISQLKICEIYDNMLQIYGTKVETGLSQKIYNFDIENGNTENNFGYDLIKSEGNPLTYIEEVKMLLLCMTLNPLCVPLFAHHIIHRFLNDPKNNQQIKIIHDEKIKMSFKVKTSEKSKYPTILNGIDNYTATPNSDGTQTITGFFDIYNEFINSNGTKLGWFFTQGIDSKNFDGNTQTANVNFSMDPTEIKAGVGYSKVFKNRQCVMIYYIHFMNRLILLNKIDLIKQLYELIIEHKINKFIKDYIKEKTPEDIKTLLNELINSNFKGEFLKRKLKEICNFDTTDINKIISIREFDENKNTIYEIIKYDYFINGFEGLYINENIMGLIKYLSDKRLTGKESEDISEQGADLTFQKQQQLARLMMISKDVLPPAEDTTNPASMHKYDTQIKELFQLRNKLILVLNKKYEEFKHFSTLDNSNKDTDQKYMNLADTILRGYTSFIDEKKVNYETAHKTITSENSGETTITQSDLDSVQDSDSLNNKIKELRGKTIKYIDEYKKALDKQLEDSKRFDLERDYAMAVAELYQIVYRAFYNDNYDNKKIASIIIKYYKQLNDNYKDININKIIKEKISDDINYTKYDNSTSPLANFEKDGKNFNLNIDIQKLNDFIKGIDNIDNIVTDNWNNEANLLYSKNVKYNRQFNNLTKAFPINWLAITLHNYLYNYIKNTGNLVIPSFDFEKIKQQTQFSVLNNLLPQTGDTQYTTGVSQLIKTTLDDNDSKRIFNYNSQPQASSGSSIKNFKDYINEVHAKRTESVRYKKELQTNLNNVAITPLPQSTVLDDYKNILTQPLPVLIPNLTTINPGTPDSTTIPNIYEYKYQELSYKLHKIEKDIRGMHTETKKIYDNLLVNTINDLNKICAQLSHIIGFNTDYKSKITVEPVKSTDLNTLEVNFIDKSTQDQTELEKNILDENINIEGSPSSYTKEYPFLNIETKYDSSTDLNTNLTYSDTEFIPGKYSLMNQIYILKYLAQNEERLKLETALNQQNNQFTQQIESLFNLEPGYYNEFNKNCGRLFKGGLRYIGARKTNQKDLSLIKAFSYINSNYSSSKIFCKDYPIIENILESYLPPTPIKDGKPDKDAELDWKKSYISDFKVFYLFANYDKANEGLAKLKCKNQYDLLENTLGFIEAIYK